LGLGFIVQQVEVAAHVQRVGVLRWQAKKVRARFLQALQQVCDLRASGLVLGAAREIAGLATDAVALEQAGHGGAAVDVLVL